MKTSLPFMLVIFLFSPLSGQSSITKAEAQAFTHRYFATLADEYAPVESFFVGSWDEDEAINLLYLYHYQYKIEAVAPPWVIVLVSSDDASKWDRRYRFYLTREQDSLRFVPKVQKEWLAEMIYPYQDESLIALPYSKEDLALFRTRALTAREVDTASIKKDHAGLVGKWIRNECVQCGNLPYYHWLERKPVFEFKPGGEFLDGGEWLVADNNLVIRHPESGAFEWFKYEMLVDGSLWLTYGSEEDYPTYFHLVRPGEEKYERKSWLDPALLPGFKILVQTQYDELGCFEQDRATFSLNRKSGFLDKTGRVIIPAEYDQTKNFNEKGIAFCNRDGRSVAIDTMGQVVDRFDFEVKFQWLNGNYFIQKEGKQGIADSLGNYVLPPIYDDIRPGGFTHYQIVKGDRWGLLDLAGNIVLPIEYEGLELRTEKLAIIKKGPSYGVLDIETGEVILPVAYDRIRIKGGPLILAFKDDKVIPYRLDGTRLLDLEYDYMEWMGWYYFGVEQNGKRGIINELGETVLPIKYDDVMWQDLSLKGIFSTTLDGEETVRDSTERIVSADELEQMREAANLLWQAQLEYEAEIVRPGLTAKRISEHYGYFNQAGSMVIPPIYDYAYDFEAGKAIVEKDDLQGIIDESGKVLLPIIFEHVRQCPDTPILLVGYKGKEGFLIFSE